MNNIAKCFLQTMAVFVMAIVATSAIADDSAHCTINVTVSTIIEWDDTINGGDFTTINLASIDSQAEIVTGSSELTLYTNANITLSADNTEDGLAVLTHQEGVVGEEDFLVTEYDIYTDGFGVDGPGLADTGAQAGARTASGTCTDNDTRVWSLYDNFISTPLIVTHVNTDGACEVTLCVRAYNDTGNVADSGAYTATQTITAIFGSDN